MQALGASLVFHREEVEEKGENPREKVVKC
jgi:hypothetical protein